MRSILSLFLCTHLISGEIRDLIPSTSEEIASLRTDFLIGGYINPLSGHPSIRVNDLHIKATQDLLLPRTYVPAQVMGRYSDNAKHEMFYVVGDLAERFSPQRGGVVLPHLYCGVNKLQSPYFRIPDPSGFVLEFEGRGDRIVLHTTTYGMTNIQGDEVSSHFDLRNTQVFFENTFVRVITPDGIERVYRLWENSSYFLAYLLEKELLPNGKAIYYRYNNEGELSKIFSGDVSGKHVYASIQCDANQYIGSDGTVATYAYERKIVTGARHNEKRKIEFSVLSDAITPLFTNTFLYDERMLLSEYSAREFPIRCEYTQEKNIPAKVSKLFSPDGHCYSLSYDSAIAGKKEGWTAVTKPNGAQVIYRFDHNLLLTAIENLHGHLINQKKFIYDKKQHISSIETRDGAGVLLLKKTYVCDSFGNPINETWEGDFSGNGHTDKLTIRRKFSRNEKGISRLIEEERDNGLSHTYSYLGNTNLLTSQTTLDHGVAIRKTIYEYDDCYNLIRTTEEGRKTTSYTRKESQPHLHRVEWEEQRDWEGNLISKTHYDYDQWGNTAIEEVYGSDGVLAYTLNKVYDERGNLLSETNPLGQTAKYKYDVRSRLIQQIPFAQKPQISRDYDCKSRLEVLKEDEHVTSFSYNEMDLVDHKSDYLGFATHYAYDAVHEKPTLIETPLTKVQMSYDAYGRENVRVDGEGYQTTTWYNAYGRPTIIQLPSGGVRTFTYDNDGDLLQETDADGISTIYTRDVLGRITSRKTAYATHVYTYDAYELIKEIDSEGNVSIFWHDSMGRKIQENRAGRVTLFSYDPLGFLASEERQDHKIFYQRDLLGRLLHKSQADQIKTAWTYEGDNIATETRGGETTSYTYDSFNRLIKKIDPTGAITSISYQEGNQVLTKVITDARGVITVEIYDPHDLLLSRQVGDIQLQKFSYDRNLRKIQQDHLAFSYTPDGHLASLIEAGQRTTYYTYTPEGRLESKRRPDGKIIYHEYDALGHLSKINHLEYRYDTLGRLIGGTGFVRTLDSFGNTLKESFENGLSVESIYDVWDRPLKHIFSDQSCLEYEYDKALLQKVTRKDALGNARYVHTYDLYDGAGLVLQETHRSPVTYAYDPAGRQILRKDEYLTESCEYDAVGNLLKRGNTHYAYDDLSQITSESDRFEGIYDGHYNRIEWNGNAIAVDSLNQLEQETYDDNGYLIRSDYVYDDFGRLIEAGGCKYTYDALDRRLTKGDISYLYLGDREIGAANLTGFTELRIPGLKNAVAIEIDQVPYIPIHDVQGTIRAIAHWRTGNVVKKNNADSFGDGTSDEIPYAYLGKRLDRESGLIYFGKRFYDPSLGRWLTPDPLGPVNNTNLYQYNFNNPICYIDPDGQFAFLVAIPFLVFGGEVAVATLGAVLAPVVYGTVVATVAYAGYELVQTINEQQNHRSDRGLMEKRSSRPDPDPRAEGSPHTIIERPGASGQYTTHNGDGTFKQYRGSGKSHGEIPRPNVKENELQQAPEGAFPGRPTVRPPEPGEIPKGSAKS